MAGESSGQQNREKGVLLHAETSSPRPLLQEKKHSSSSGSLRVLLCAVGGGYSHKVAFIFICYIEAG